MNNLPTKDSQSQSQEDLQVEALRALQSEIPLNDFGLPTGIYRTDLLPFHDYQPHKPNGANNVKLLGSPEESEGAPDGSRSDDLTVAPQADPLTDYRIAGFPAQALSNAYVPLQYDEGFPAFLSGSPFWCRLEYEPGDAFQAFDRYLHMNMGKSANQDEDEYDGKAASGTRSLSTLVAELHPGSDILRMTEIYQTYYHLYYWGSRAHAFDLFRVAQFRKQTELRAIETQDEHYVASKRLRHRLGQYFENETEFWDLMTPKVAIDFFKTVTQLERISSGVPAAGPESESREGLAGKPFELTFRTIAQTNRSAAAGTTVSEDGEVLDKALEDPAATELLQELIIRTGG